jgi:dimethylaniline monooxygenase (N-oxide forming)
MSDPAGMRVAVIGGGVSGIAAAKVLKQNGFVPVIFEKSEQIGGIWALSYPGVRLQNIGKQYHLCDFPWSFEPDFHPTAAQVLRYFCDVVEHFQLDLRCGHEVIKLEERPDGWIVRYRNKDGVHEDAFGYVIVSSGQYSEAKHRPKFPGEEQFHGEILTERDIRSLDIFNAKRVLVMGFGKSALDMATFAAQRGAQVHHVFRTPRWTVPERILGLHCTYIFLTRIATMMMPAWVHPSALERFLHKRLGWIVSGFWGAFAALLRWQEMRNAWGKGAAAMERVKVTQPGHALVSDLRSAAALAPEPYHPFIAAGRILPYHAELAGFSERGLVLKDGREIACDLVVLSLGSESPTFPFLPEKYRKILEAEKDGPQFYRHLIHPCIAYMGFAGFNHAFLHIPAVEIGTLWLCATLRGELELPPGEEMEKEIERIRAWKREHINFEPSRACAVNTRYQQYLDILLEDLNISPYRKMPNILREVFARYGAWDYRGVFDEYERKKACRTAPLKPMTSDM